MDANRSRKSGLNCWNGANFGWISPKIKLKWCKSASILERGQIDTKKMECAVSPPWILKHLRTLCGVPTLFSKYDQMIQNGLCGVPTPHVDTSKSYHYILHSACMLGSDKVQLQYYECSCCLGRKRQSPALICYAHPTILFRLFKGKKKQINRKMTDITETWR